MPLQTAMQEFLSGPPEVKLVNAFARPFENAVATARTCYSSSGIITPEEVSGDFETDPAKRRQKAANRDRLARSIYAAGHHTTLQHAHFQFAISKVSRHLIWSFLHSHPFYNSEQVSQRYVEVKPGSFAVPPLEAEAKELYLGTVERQMRDYHELIELLVPVVADHYFRRFWARKGQKKYQKELRKKAQEIARYVLPVSTLAYLYHTISAITLLRYHRLCEQFDTLLEQKLLVQGMMEEVLRFDPLLGTVLEDRLPLEATPEFEAFSAFEPRTDGGGRRDFLEEFDRSLEGRTSKLIDFKPHNEAVVAQAVREVLGLSRARVGDDDALGLVLDPAHNRLFGEKLNVLTMSKLGRTLCHASYTFRKKLSHTGDSQDQRHRMTPGSRPILAAHLGEEPDYITPALIHECDAARSLYRQSMERSWDTFTRLIRLGTSREMASYVLPNALAVRLTESADLVHLHHKLKARLCYNAQEEIWRASWDEAQQILEVNPRIGRYLLPPCGLRLLAKSTPYCPEGDRYCGVPVWKIPLSAYERVL